jgi:spermidine synthase
LSRRWFFGFFFVSGFCSLVYEVVWLRLAMAKFGVTTPMVSIVLSIFMAGLGLGSWLGGELVRRRSFASAAGPLRCYALAELLIGVSGIAVPLVLNAGYQLVRDAGRGLLWGSSFYYLASGGWMLLSLLPWCTCMGATFPFAMEAIRALKYPEFRESFSFLYLANVLGAVLGTLAPAFLLIELLGFRGTLTIAIGFNTLLAITVLALSRKAAALSGAEEATATSSTQSQSNGTLWLLFTTGLCSMAMEVVWTREYTPYLGTLVYAFASILAIYLLATFLGSTAYRTWSGMRDGKKSSALWIPLAAVSLLPLLFSDPRLFPPYSYLSKTGFLMGLIRVALGVGPFSAFAGFLTPMLVDRWSGGDARKAGRAYAINIAGSIFGPLVAGFVVLPLLGEHWGLCLLAVPLMAAGIRAAWSPRTAPLFHLAPGELFAGTCLAAVLLVAGTRDYETRFPERRVMRDYSATVIATTIIDAQGPGKHLIVNGVGMTILTPITKVMAHLPLAMMSKRAESVLVICFGMGTTFRSVLTWDVDTTAVELIPSVPKLYGYYHSDGPALFHLPRAHLIIDDGRRFLERSDQQFDLITVDPPPPINAAASGMLYSKQFYAAIRPHLRPTSIFETWFPAGDDATLSSIAKALKESFPYVRASRSLDGFGIHFWATLQPLAPHRFEDLPRQLPPRAAADLVEWNPGRTPKDMLNEVLGRGLSLDDLIARVPGVPAMSDDRPVNEYFLLRRVYPGESRASSIITASGYPLDSGTR